MTARAANAIGALIGMTMFAGPPLLAFWFDNSGWLMLWLFLILVW